MRQFRFQSGKLLFCPIHISLKKADYLKYMIIVSVFTESCAHNDQEVLHMGLNASIVDMDTENKTLTVEDSGEKEVFGDNCVIDCTDTYIIYCNYDTGEVNDIDFEDLQTGDKVILSIYESQLSLLEQGGENIQADRVKLGTQRLN